MKVDCTECNGSGVDYIEDFSHPTDPYAAPDYIEKPCGVCGGSGEQESNENERDWNNLKYSYPDNNRFEVQFAVYEDEILKDSWIGIHTAMHDISGNKIQPTHWRYAFKK